MDFFGAYKSFGTIKPLLRKLICLDPVDFNSETHLDFQSMSSSTPRSKSSKLVVELSGKSLPLSQYLII
ncbi:hypothetical protein RDI58_001519 [Solanum bulbocastanum]|uniref:Uncharacterized protein n=1 Tax=Solanum bulbocastanum TaxID=147425 RepID=A0AAN8UC05_SOLBU